MGVFDFVKKREEKKNLILGILLKEEEALIMVFKKKYDRVNLEFVAKIDYSVGLERIVDDIDEVLFKLDKKIGFEIKETIFFLYSHFIEEENNKLKDAILIKIKEISKSLGLKPLGYIEIIDCLSSYITYQDKLPFTSLVIELDKSYLSLFVYKGGKLFIKKISKKSADIIEDIENILLNREKELLVPTRIILYDGKEIDDYSLKIINYQWSDEIFIQNPKIELIKENDLLEAMTFILNKELTSNEKGILSDQDLDEGERFGFVIGKDIKKRDEKSEDKKEKIDQNEEGKDDNRIQTGFINYFKEKFLFISQKFFKFFYLIKKKLSYKMVISFSIIFIFLILIVNEYFFHHANISLLFKPKIVNKKILLDLNYSISTWSANIEVGKKTTGKQIIGEKAKGEVIVYNTNLFKDKNIKKGTKIEVDNLGFVFMDDVKIATAQSATAPGIANAKLEAENIGEEYNIKKGKRFNIDENSYAQNLENFTGGMKKQIKTISNSDISSLEDKVIEESRKLKNKKLNQEIIILNDLRRIEIKSKEFSGEIGEEAEEVMIKAKVSLTDFYLNKEQLIIKIINLIKNEVNSAYLIKKDFIRYKIEKSQFKDGKVGLDLNLMVNLVNNIDSNKLKSKIVFKPNSYLNDILKKEYEVVDYNLKNSNSIFFLNFYLPLFKKNIKIEVDQLR